jgi:alkyl hydroperoxide reductase subunit AhpF
MFENEISSSDDARELLPSFLGHLPEVVRLHVWCDESGSPEEREATRLIKELAGRFESIEGEFFPRRTNYDFYPVIGIMGVQTNEIIDHGLRIIGLPSGYQMTSLISGIQAVAFKGMTSEATTRIQLARLNQPVSLELITDADDEAGPVMAQKIFNMAVVSPFVKSYLIMGDFFPQAFIRYSVNYLPHIVINERIHLEGVIEEGELLSQIAGAL